MEADTAENAEEYEELHVHGVYEQIASHFSSTRYKPWPIVERFLTELPDGAVGLDVGCGNGKYLTVNPRVYIIASDRSLNLAKIASAHQPHSTVVADSLALPHPNGRFDFGLSIAVVHHLSTPERRIMAIRRLLESLKPSSQSNSTESTASRPSSRGRALIYVWALEQKESRRGWDETHAQDVMVPWVMKGARGPQNRGGGEQSETSKIFQRYYHLYRRGELESDIQQAGGFVLDSGYEKDNWWAIASRSEDSM